MSKSTVKRYLNDRSKEELVEILLDLYSAKKDAKDYLEYVTNPDDNKMLEHYKAIIVKEFFPTRGEPKMRFSVCRKAISDFKQLNPDPALLSDLMVTLVEQACLFTDENGDMDEPFYTSLETNFVAAVKHITKHHQKTQFKYRLIKCVKLTTYCGYCLYDSLCDCCADHGIEMR